MAIKVKDLAAMLNLSPATISLVLNNRPGISETTREKVRSAVRELGYDELLTEDITEKENILFIVYRKHGIESQSTPYFSQIFSEIIEGVESQVKASGYNLMISYVDEYTVADEVMAIRKEQVKGVLVLATEMQEKQMNAFSEMQVPIVIIDNYMEHREFDCITINNEQGVYEVIQHLVNMGHSKIGYLHIDANANNFSERCSGFYKAMDTFGLKADKADLITICTAGGEAVYQVLKSKLSQRKSMPTAFFADNDIIAISAMRVLKELGYEIPQDVSIIGFDNITLSEMLNPPLTSIQIPKRKIGIVAVNTIIDKIKYPSEGVIKAAVRTKLIVRESVKKLS